MHVCTISVYRKCVGESYVQSCAPERARVDRPPIQHLHCPPSFVRKSPSFGLSKRGGGDDSPPLAVSNAIREVHGTDIIIV